MFNIPNFITNKVIGKVLNLDDKIKNSLDSKIILIENADPVLIGYLPKLKVLQLNMVVQFSYGNKSCRIKYSCSYRLWSKI